MSLCPVQITPLNQAVQSLSFIGQNKRANSANVKNIVFMILPKKCAPMPRKPVIAGAILTPGPRFIMMFRYVNENFDAGIPQPDNCLWFLHSLERFHLEVAPAAVRAPPAQAHVATWLDAGMGGVKPCGCTFARLKSSKRSHASPPKAPFSDGSCTAKRPHDFMVFFFVGCRFFV